MTRESENIPLSQDVKLLQAKPSSLLEGRLSDQACILQANEGPQNYLLKAAGGKAVIGAVDLEGREGSGGKDDLVSGPNLFIPKQTQRRRYRWELGDCNTQYQRLSSSGGGSPLVGSCSSSKVSKSSNDVSDGGIAICNSRFWSANDCDISLNMWEL